MASIRLITVASSLYPGETAYRVGFVTDSDPFSQVDGLEELLQDFLLKLFQTQYSSKLYPNEGGDLYYTFFTSGMNMVDTAIDFLQSELMLIFEKIDAEIIESQKDLDLSITNNLKKKLRKSQLKSVTMDEERADHVLVEFSLETEYNQRFTGQLELEVAS